MGFPSGVLAIRVATFRIASRARRASGAGVPLPVVARILGHSGPKMTLRYGHVADREIENAAERIVSNAGLSAIFGIAFPDDALARTAGFGDETPRPFGLCARAGY